MLVLSRKTDECIVIDDGIIKITVVNVIGDKVRLGIEAPGNMRVDRLEVHERRRKEGPRPGDSRSD